MTSRYNYNNMWYARHRPFVPETGKMEQTRDARIVLIRETGMIDGGGKSRRL